MLQVQSRSEALDQRHCAPVAPSLIENPALWIRWVEIAR